jgi:hypothetical protein
MVASYISALCSLHCDSLKDLEANQSVARRVIIFQGVNLMLTPNI